jgi:nitroreductase
MDAYLAVASKRDQREYAETPVPEDAVTRILDAGRIAGSSKNRQPWRFLVLRGRGLVAQGCADRLRASQPARRPAGDRNCGQRPGPVAFDAGRAAQNMMQAGWSEGVVSCPNAITNPESLSELLGLEADAHVLSLFQWPHVAIGVT